MTHTPETRADEIRRRFQIAHEALALASSMILGGEQHSERSRAIIRQGLAACNLATPISEAEG